VSFACAALALAALPTGARADEFVVARLHLKGTHGYTLDISLSSDYSEIRASKRGKGLDEVADYSDFRVRNRGERFVANFGSLGRASVLFRPSGPDRHRKLACKGDPEVEERGVFEGVVSFHGEHGFTSAGARRVRGTVSRISDRRCRHRAAQPGARSSEASPLITSMAATSTATPVSFVAQHAEGKDPPFDTRFIADSEEERGEVLIDRAVTVEGPATGFAFDPNLNSATVSPPAPFSGSASFQRLDDFTSRWEGPLSVTLPGTTALPLTGRDFAWSLRKESEDAVLGHSIFGEFF
jgi:hypothetical protein